MSATVNSCLPEGKKVKKERFGLWHGPTEVGLPEELGVVHDLGQGGLVDVDDAELDLPGQAVGLGQHRGLVLQEPAHDVSFLIAPVVTR